MCKKAAGVALERIKRVITGSEEGLFADVGRRNFMAISDGGVSWEKVLSDQTGFGLNVAP